MVKIKMTIVHVVETDDIENAVVLTRARLALAGITHREGPVMVLGPKKQNWRIYVPERDGI